MGSGTVVPTGEVVLSGERGRDAFHGRKVHQSVLGRSGFAAIKHRLSMLSRADVRHSGAARLDS